VDEKGSRRMNIVLKFVYMNVNEKMTPVEIIPGIWGGVE
jgi:hypothetical protein